MDKLKLQSNSELKPITNKIDKHACVGGMGAGV